MPGVKKTFSIILSKAATHPQELSFLEFACLKYIVQSSGLPFQTKTAVLLFLIMF